METMERICQAAQYLATHNWAPFADLSILSGLSYGELIANKQQIERLIRAATPGATVTSRIDLNPPGFEVES